MQRQITVYESALNGKTTVLENVEAQTLGELKRIFDAKGINYENMDFMEGVSNTILRDDSSVLPTNIPYKGRTVNDLFIYLSVKNKKVASGLVDTTSRKEMVSFIKEHNLQAEIKDEFGTDYTHVSNKELAYFLECREANNGDENPKECDNEAACSAEVTLENIVDILQDLVASLYNDGYVSGDVHHRVMALGKNVPTKDNEPKSNFADDINDIISQFK